ncbi:hypothetical protein K504DRAFT_519279 [Pleomassaria siparia CBS 279.74]|uniref:Uncharacterized protein n=1 Tax=Pleomassaria siparia CBS 279.74 TaxID=1314801 RepID=A0A6G1JUT6_9PLEO|nr:hypothetical protein K504DRAFT_519279 [Pleomassaria siparia CBS 279.74]
MPPVSNLLTTILSLSPRAVLPSILIPAEENGFCRSYADSQSAATYSFSDDAPVNVTCWTTTSMPGDPKGLAQGMDTGSYIWAWASIPANYSLSWTAKHWGVGNVGEVQGGKAGGKGCWIHEDHLKLDGRKGGDDLKQLVQSCGTASRHQVTTLIKTSAPSIPFFQCHNCTDLSQSACQTVRNTDRYGWADIGCWSKGTPVGGNDTWVKLVEEENCHVTPDQLSKDWHGLPAGHTCIVFALILVTSDKPNQDLHPYTRERMLALLRQWQDEDCTMDFAMSNRDSIRAD